MKFLMTIATCICAVGWFFAYVGGLALVKYMRKKNYVRPTKLEVQKCSMEVLSEIFKIH